jgi:hypothetical protein
VRSIPRTGTFEEFCTYYKRVISIESNGCWNWKGSHNDKGYARVSTGKGNSKNAMGSGLRVFYEQKYGKIPAGLEPHHTCRNRSCVNPDHAEIVTHQENCERDAKIRLHLKASK